MRHIRLPLLSLVVLSGCASWRVAQPGKITLRQAMKEVAQGLNEMQDARGDRPKSGLVPTEVTIVFNVSASAQDNGKIYIEQGAVPGDVLKTVKLGAESGWQVQASRGNTVTIKFANVLYAPQDTLLRAAKPGDIKRLLDELKEAGVPPVTR